MSSEVNILECNVQDTLGGYTCTVQLENFANTAKNTVLGTSFTTDVFDMHFPDSGNSSWVMQIYPNGQYDAGGHSNDHLSAYLKLDTVENENKRLVVDIDFKVILINGFQRRYIFLLS